MPAHRRRCVFIGCFLCHLSLGCVQFCGPSFDGFCRVYLILHWDFRHGYMWDGNEDGIQVWLKRPDLCDQRVISTAFCVTEQWGGTPYHHNPSFTLLVLLLNLNQAPSIVYCESGEDAEDAWQEVNIYTSLNDLHGFCSRDQKIIRAGGRFFSRDKA